MSPHDLILEYVEATRAIERWTARAEQLTCPNEWGHTTNNRLTTAGTTCADCRNRLHAQHKARDARTARNTALADQHKYALKHEARAHEKRERIRVKRGTGLA